MKPSVRIDVSFLAPVPVGSEVLVVFAEEASVFGGWTDTDPLVVDRATGIVYGSGWVPSEIHAGDLAIEHHTSSYRRAPGRPAMRARVVSCLVVARGSGKSNHLATTLGLAELPPDEGAYR